MIKAAIFDADGTRLMSSGMWDSLGERFLISKGCEPKPDLHERIRTLSLEQGAKLLREEYLTKTPIPEIISGIKAMIDGFYRYEVLPADGADALLPLLSSRGISMCVATAGSAELTTAALERTGLSKFFARVLACSDYAPKSAPDIFLACCEALRSDPNETIVFEDQLHAVITAKKAGFVTAAVRDIAEPEQAALKKAADYYEMSLSGYAEILPRVLE